MRQLPAPGAGLAAMALALVACAEAPLPAAGPDPATAEAACAAATAAHVGKAAEAVTAVWDGPSPDGGGTVSVTDAGAAAGERVHSCVVRADGSLVALLHTAS